MSALSPSNPHPARHLQQRVRAALLVALFALFVGSLAHCQPPAMHRPDAAEPPTTPDLHRPRPEQPRDEAHLGGVGGTCDSDDSCQSALGCETRIPGGYCTKGCTSSTQCPGKSACVRIKFNDGTAFLRCLRTCFTTDDCRDGFYCYHPPGAWKLICLPDEAKPQP